MASQANLYQYFVRVSMREHTQDIAPQVKIHRFHLPEPGREPRTIQLPNPISRDAVVIERKMVASKMSRSLCRVLERELAKMVKTEIKRIHAFSQDESDIETSESLCTAADLVIDTLIFNFYMNLGVLRLPNQPEDVWFPRVTTFKLAHEPDQYRYDWRLAYCDAHLQFQILVFDAGDLRHVRAGVFLFQEKAAHAQGSGTDWRTAGDVQGFRYGNNPPCPHCREFFKAVSDFTVRDPGRIGRGCYGYSAHVVNEVVAYMANKFRHIETVRFCGRAEAIVSEVVAVNALTGLACGVEQSVEERVLAIVILVLALFIPPTWPESPFADIMEDDIHRYNLGDIEVDTDTGIVHIPEELPVEPDPEEDWETDSDRSDSDVSDSDDSGSHWSGSDCETLCPGGDDWQITFNELGNEEYEVE